ncbi:Protein VTS1 [Nakaseomyces glabratus]|uniref:RNA-binding protein VTS1 n=1 Tax=Candida glabrata TaxID=5478 RepID=A0A0W0D7Y5_CANGB|nr:Protein VTS1 [Nakaseomyces glabratus]KTB07910.1 Protein VTS1 [Nakaseomyces glabratus]KTB10056.1 Protein VTS1 [Nakaseomyces glabratus]KTB24010.1 Protein VTS1 [Nakaseomyces glabratus]
MLANKFDEMHHPVPDSSMNGNPLCNSSANVGQGNRNSNPIQSRGTGHSSSPIYNNPLRTAHPGAVLLSPQSSSLNIIDTTVGNAMSPTVPSSAASSIFFNDFGLDSSTNLNKSAMNANSNRPMTTIPLSSNSTSQSYTLSFQQENKKTNSNSTLNNVNNGLVTAGSVSNSHNNIFLDSFLSHDNTMQPNNSSNNNNNQNANNSLNFNTDVNQLCTWMSMLTANQQSVVMDNIISVLNESTLNYTKMKLDTMFGTTSSSPTSAEAMQNLGQPKENGNQNSNQNNIASPIPSTLDSVFANNSMKYLQSQSTSGSNHFHQAFNSKGSSMNWSSQASNIQNPAYDYLNDYRQRPKSAEPPLSHQTHYQPSNLSISQFKPQNSNGNSSNTNTNRNLNNINTSNNNSTANNNNIGSNNTKRMNDITNSADVPVTSSFQNLTLNNQNGSTTTSSNNGNSSSGASSNSSMNPKSLTDPKLLNNIPIWLKTLRLHKYSDILNDLSWEKLIYLEDEDLLKRGVLALGARRKLLKAFTIVRDYKNRDLIDNSAYLNIK